MEAGDISQKTIHDVSQAQRAQVLVGVNQALDQALQLGGRAENFTDATRLLGEIPELDSMAVLTVLTSLEEQFGIVIEDDDVSADIFATVGDLVTLVINKSS